MIIAITYSLFGSEIVIGETRRPMRFTTRWPLCTGLHVVPRGVMRIRHFGLLANRSRRVTLTRAEPPQSRAAPHH